MSYQPSTVQTQELQLPVLIEQPANITLAFTIDPRIANSELRWLWSHLRDEWLATPHGRGGHDSPHTRLAYTRDSNEFFAWLATQTNAEADILQPWQITTTHVRYFADWLRHKGNGENTINRKLAACSSFYSFVINEVHMVNGIERSAFFDAAGNTRANPFKTGNLKRSKVNQYGKAAPLGEDDLAALFKHLEERQHTLLGSRNYALILSYFLTASRNSEIVNLNWGDIRPSRTKRGQFVFNWKGKGGKEEVNAFPERAYNAIVHYLKLSGRLVDIQDSDYIFIPHVTHGLGNLVSSKRGTNNNRKPVSGKNVVTIFQTALRLAGVKNYRRRIHDLRHTYAELFDGDIEDLRRILHHESLATTTIYKSALKDPVDNHSERMFQKTLGI